MIFPLKINNLKELIIPFLSKEENEALDFKNKGGKLTVSHKLFKERECYYFHQNGLMPQDSFDSLIMYCKVISNHKTLAT